jgi:hypothetical protein
MNAKLTGANLIKSNLTRANLQGANLTDARLISTVIDGAIISECSIFGASVWDLSGKFGEQKDLIITKQSDPVITVDNIKIAQFVYLILNNEEIRDVINTLTTKSVLILGRFTPERKVVLDSLREALRKRNYLPILFDFEAPRERDLTETILTLAHLCRFIIADLTDAKSIPQELTVIVPNLPSVAIQPLILKTQREYAMFEHIERYPWVLPIYEYENEEQLLLHLMDKVITPSEIKVREIAKKKG